MKRYNICVYAICKNEEKFVDRWVDSMSEADCIIALDTGSSDDTIGALRRRGVVTVWETIKPWRFDAARNRSLELVPNDVDICVCTDLDEVFTIGWREKLEAAWSVYDDTCTAKIGYYIYNWSENVQFLCSKIHSRHGFEWKYPIHEYLAHTGLRQPARITAEGVILNHYPDNSKSRDSYLPLLELAVEELPKDARMAFYLGREYSLAKKFKESTAVLTRYLKLPSACWSDERSDAMRIIAYNYFAQGDKKNVYKWFHRAVAEQSEMREPYIEFAKAAEFYGDYELVVYLAREACKIKEKSKTYINMGYAWDNTPYNLELKACKKLGIKECPFCSPN